MSIYTQSAANLSGINGTSQREAIPGTNQVRNEAGGFGWEVDAWSRLGRFLGLGSDGGNYHATAEKLTATSAASVQECLKIDGPRTVAQILDFSVSGKGIKNDPCLFALALAMNYGAKLRTTKKPVNPEGWHWTKEGYVPNVEDASDILKAVYETSVGIWRVKNAEALQADATREAAYNALSQVARTHGDLLRLRDILNNLGHGWGSGSKRAFAAWYNDKPADKLAYQLLKYRQREGLDSSRLIACSHPKTESEEHNVLYSWVQKGWETVGEEPHPNPLLAQVWAHERAKKLKDPKDVAKLIREYRLSHEMVPSNFHGEKLVWEALLENMPMTAMFRNLGRLTHLGIIGPFSEWNNKVIDQLTKADALRKARIHPFQILKVLKTYETGKGDKGSLVWKPEQKLVTALDEAFYLSMKNVEPTGKKILLAVDDSHSMHDCLIGGLTGVTPSMAAAAMALVTATVEPNHHIVAFDIRVKDLKISPSMRLDDVIKEVGKNPSQTDCSAPMTFALKEGYPVEAFGLYTDNLSWAGTTHASQALVKFRQKTGIPARMYAAQLGNYRTTICDPNDVGQLDVLGFSADAPQVINNFLTGQL